MKTIISHHWFKLPPRHTSIILGYALSIVLISTQLFNPYQQIFFVLFSVFIGWLFFRKKDESAAGKHTEWPTWWLLIPFAVLIFTRVILYIKYADFPQLGYDMGIYKYEFEQAANFGRALKTSFYPGLIILVSLLQKIGFSTDFFMREFYILLNGLIGVMVYLTAREFFGKKAALMALVLYVGSLTQFTAYYFFLYKNVLAISLLLGALILLHRRSHWAIPVGLYLGAVQPPDFLILVFAMVGFFVYRFRHPEDRRYLLRVGSVVGALFLLVFLLRFNQIVEGVRLILYHAEHWDPSISGGGVFITPSDYIQRAIYYLPFALVGWMVSVKKAVKNHSRLNPLHFGLLISLVIVLFQLVFYKRYLIELDIFALIFAGMGMAHLIQKYSQKITHKMLWAIFGIAILINISVESVQTAPLIPSLEAARINTLCKLPKNSLMMATDNFYSPWLRGYSCHEVIAPGLFELNLWGLEGWSQFWSGDKEKVVQKMDELRVYRKPIYLFIGAQQPDMDFSGMERFTKIRSYLWRWDFPR